MITAVDTNILVDVFLADKQFGKNSAQALRASINAGAVIICGVVFVETMPIFPSIDEFNKAVAILGIKTSAISMESYLAAATAWKVYRRSGGGRNRVVADFLIGAHAQTEADRLLTRDSGFYRQYFSKLKVLEP